MRAAVARIGYAESTINGRFHVPRQVKHYASSNGQEALITGAACRRIAFRPASFPGTQG
jgi:hypothetical protein